MKKKCQIIESSVKYFKHYKKNGPLQLVHSDLNGPLWLNWSYNIMQYIHAIVTL